MRRMRDTAGAGAGAVVAALAIMLALVSAAGCGGGRFATTQPTAIPTSTPFPTWTPTLAVPSHTVSFTTSDHIRLAGLWYGQGQTVVIFSNQTDTLSGNWQPIAQQFAVRGYAALAYDYRGRGDSQGTYEVGPTMMTDLRAAIAFAQRQGARRIVLIGASIGGPVTANVAATMPVAAVVLISAPSDFIGLEVTPAVMAHISAPKLLMNSRGDSYAQDIQTMYDAAGPPKALKFYPGVDHGLDLLTGSYGADATGRALAFVERYAPASA